MPNKFNSQEGALHILVLIAAVGFLLFILITNTANFKDRLFSTLFPKPPSKASEEAPSVPDEILVKFKPGVSDKAREHVRNSHGLEKLEEITQIGLEKLKVNPQARDRIMDALQRNPNVEIVSPNYLGELLGHNTDTTPNDTNYLNKWQYNLENTGQSIWDGYKYVNGKVDADVDAPEAWDITKGSSSVVVAVIDTGVKGDHEDLVNKLVAGWNTYNNNSDTSDPHGHGTAVSGVVGAETGNSKGMASLGWNIKVMPLRNCCSSPTLVPFYDTIEAIYFAADHGAKVINMSLGYLITKSNDVTLLQDAIDYGFARGVISVAATGSDNKNFIYYPARSNNVIAVGATDAFDNRWVDSSALGSNYGPEIDVVAPGKSIPTTSSSGGYANWTGTSFASPQVAALAALIFSVQPNYTPQQVMDIIKSTTDDLGDPGFDIYYGMGRINAGRALQQATGITPPPPDTTSPTVSITSPTGGTVSGSVDITANATDNIGVTRVEFYIDGLLLPNGSDNNFPYLASWDTSLLNNNSSHTIMVKAYDLAGNVGTSPLVSVSINNPTPTLTPTPLPSPSPTSIIIMSPTPSPTPTITNTANPNKGKGQVNKK